MTDVTPTTNAESRIVLTTSSGAGTYRLLGAGGGML